MTRDQVPPEIADAAAAAGAREGRSAWWVWLGWAWIGLLVLSAAAELFDLEGLRLALDFRRHLR